MKKFSLSHPQEFAPLAQPPSKTVVDRQTAYLASPEKDADRAYWLQELAVMPEPFELGRGRNDGEPFFVRQICEPAFAKACQAFTENTGVSVFNQFMTALTVCVARMARVDHFAICVANDRRQLTCPVRRQLTCPVECHSS